jgi:uncharacterized protein YgbK (DUF1537 family)
LWQIDENGGIIRLIFPMIGVIADDLTGAAELGAAGLRRGLRAKVVMGGAQNLAKVGKWESERVGELEGRQSPAPTHSSPQLVCFDTDSRFCTPVQAGRQAAGAAGLLTESGARWIYKKVDSVLRGQVLAELEAIMIQLGLERALLVPANPSLGRVIRAGQYFVGGKPIHETDFARDPWFPRTSPKVLDLVGSPQTFPISVCRVSDPFASFGIVIGEVGNSADLQYWASHRRERLLLAGGAEFFGALLEAAGHVPMTLPLPIASTEPGRELFVSGSTSDSARKFVETAGVAGWPICSLPEGLIHGAAFTSALLDSVTQSVVTAFRSHRRVILNVGLPLVRDAAVARSLSGFLSDVAAAVIRIEPVDHVYAEGGATAIELARRMGWNRLKVLGELAPGVATMEPEGEESLAFTIKPGSYVWPQFEKLGAS